MSYTVLCKKCNYVSYAREAQEKSKVNGNMCYHNFETIDVDFVDLVKEFGNYNRVNHYFECTHCNRLFDTIDDKNNHHILDRCLKDSISINLAHAYDKLFRPEIYFSFFNYVNHSKLTNHIQLDCLYISWIEQDNLTKLSYKTFMDDLYRLEEYLLVKGLPNFLVVNDSSERFYTVDFDIFNESYIYFTGDYTKIYDSFRRFFRYMYDSAKFYKRTSIEIMYQSYRYCSNKLINDKLVTISTYDKFKNYLIKYLDYLKDTGKQVYITIDSDIPDQYILDKNLFKDAHYTQLHKPERVQKKRKREQFQEEDSSREVVVNNQTSIVPESNGYIYLLQEREFIKTGEPVYKLGKTTTTIQQRLQGYPKGSRLILCIEVEDCHEREKKLLDKFKREFKLRKDIGNEYFEGDKQTMMKYIR